MKKLHNIAIFSLSVFYAVSAHATDLTEVLVQTYKTNPDLIAEREILKATDENYNQAFSGWLPSAEINADREHDSVKSGRRRAVSSVGTSKSFAIQQPVFNGGETIARMHQAKNQIKAEQATLIRIEQRAFLDAITAYMDVIRNDEVVKLNEKNLEVLKKSKISTDERFRLGEVTRTDAAQANARVSRAISEKTRAIGEAMVARATFKNVTGMDATTLTMPNEASNLPRTKDEAIIIAVKNNPSVKSAESSVLAAKNAVSASKAALLPDVSLRADYRNTDGILNLGGNVYDTKTATINLRMPLYQSGAEYSRIRAGKNTVNRRKFEAEGTMRDVAESATRYWENLEVSRANLISSRDAVVAATTALEGVTQEIEFGSRTVIEALNAQQELFQTQTDVVRAKHDDIIASYSLKSVMGGLGISDALPTCMTQAGI